MKENFHQRLIQFVVKSLHNVKGKYKIKVNGRNFAVHSNVYSPKFYNLINFPTCHFLAANLYVKSGDYVLDMGTGTGIQAIFAAEKAKSIVAVDISSEAIICAEENALLNKIENIEFRQGDLFGPVKGEKFDLIIWTPPTWFGTPKSLIEKSWLCGDNGELIIRFCSEASQYLKKHGRIQFVCNNNSEFIISRLKKNGFKVEQYCKEKRFLRNSNFIYLARID